ncbi:pseudouridine-5'-phosphate glycosidase [Frankia sp. CNm7]|uniref:Pseudouridine-5'-phosphate glycosidase n=1 Tax=Frankia nepalensis TaxID=1836974 RepID=A0A937RLQ1_9ACTN|nr:pseudouridine-5'-phosphate glycosidase [Frankia nepalensis]MBL7501338.1 pseudouridine-5'-phosphate glycosidase [Frankia nepalensis]MBL7509875.1 pseudouridine-5'-phosphate glycosidase [Frankia nepalensis]MBL7520686.1 pseudouridine-5'-phosphate glycosidase [Frankia nepalensis]MBL7629634.1 pseudouridine-5'-phosphate glycosidase [Frankia nepalensis]
MPDMKVSATVAEALAAGRPVVALESTLLAHGLPAPRNRAVGAELEELVREHGAVPATIAVLAGVPTIGLDEAGLAQITEDPNEVLKLSVRDLAPAAALGRTGATTVASTAWLAARVGIRVFATGGLGGVHRGSAQPSRQTSRAAGHEEADGAHGSDGHSYDESADLPTLAATRITVVCAGVKSILDVGATLERLETLGVAVLGWRTADFPGFYLPGTGHRLDWRVQDAGEVAAVMAAADRLGAPGALVVANPVAAPDALDRELHDRVLADALAAASRAGLRGKAVTPFLLAAFHRETAGASLEVNLAVVRGNVTVAAQIANAWSQSRR